MKLQLHPASQRKSTLGRIDSPPSLHNWCQSSLNPGATRALRDWEGAPAVRTDRRLGRFPLFSATPASEPPRHHHNHLAGPVLWSISDCAGNWGKQGVCVTFIFSQILCSKILSVGKSIHSLVAKSRTAWDFETLWRNPATHVNLKGYKGQEKNEKNDSDDNHGGGQHCWWAGGWTRSNAGTHFLTDYKTLTG